MHAPALSTRDEADRALVPIKCALSSNVKKILSDDSELNAYMQDIIQKAVSDSAFLYYVEMEFMSKANGAGLFRRNCR